MNQTDMRDLLRAQPFIPFRLNMTNGTSYEIRHSELVIPLPRTVVVALDGDLAQGLPERTVTLPLLHIVSVDHLEPAPKGNGQA